MRRAAGGTRTAGAGGAAGAAACCCSPCCCCSPWARTMGQCVVLRALVGCRAAAKATRAPCRAARMAGAAAGDGDAAAAMCKYGLRDAALGLRGDRPPCWAVLCSTAGGPRRRGPPAPASLGSTQAASIA